MHGLTLYTQEHITLIINARDVQTFAHTMKGACCLDECNPIFELTHPYRLNIVKFLREGGKRLTEISRHIGAPTPEISRHINRLLMAKIIYREKHGMYRLTPLGKIVEVATSHIEFMINKSPYLSSHDVSVIPSDYLVILPWNTLTTLSGTMEVGSLIEKASEEAEKFIYVMSEELMRSVVDIEVERARAGVCVRKIYLKGEKMPQEYLKTRNLEVRVLREIPLGLKVTDKIAGIALPNISTGKIDYSMALISTSADFIHWCISLFNNYWGIASPIGEAGAGKR